MKLSMRTDYGVRALTDLALRHDRATVPTAEIAQRQDIPEPYLDQLLTTLRKAGFIHSRRGPQGGHALARPAPEITMGQVVRALEGSLAPLACLDDPNGCAVTSECPQRDVWQAVAASTSQILDATTIADLAQRQAQRERAGAYQI